MQSAYEALRQLDPEGFDRETPLVQPLDLTPAQWARLHALDAAKAETAMAAAAPPEPGDSHHSGLAVVGGRTATRRSPRAACAGDDHGGCTCSGTDRRYCRRRSGFAATEPEPIELAKLAADLGALQEAEDRAAERGRRDWLTRTGRQRPCPACGRAFFPACLQPECPGCGAAVENKLALS